MDDEKKEKLKRWVHSWWLVLLFLLLLLVGVGREAFKFFLEHRVMDLLIYFSAGGLGVVLAHRWVKRSMAKSERHLGQIVDQCMRDLLAKLDDTNSEEQIPLPMPYLLATLRYADSSRGFGYFDGKLMGRDPRLWLDLSLDQALESNADEALKLERVRTATPQEAQETKQKAARVISEMTEKVNQENARRAKLAAEKAANEAAKKPGAGAAEQRAKAPDETQAAKMASDVAAEVMKRLQEPAFLKASEDQIRKAVDEAVKKAFDKPAWTQLTQMIFELVKERIKSSEKT
jgi:hypothetical protein